MNDENKKVSASELLKSYQIAMNIHRRTEENVARWTEWQNQLQVAQEAGESMSNFWEDPVYNALVSERQQIMQELRDHLANRPRVGQASDILKQHFTSAEKEEFYQQAMQQLLSTPPKILENVRIIFERAVDYASGLTIDSPDLRRTSNKEE